MIKHNEILPSIIDACLLAMGIAVAGYFVSQTLYNSKIALNTAEVKGLAERRVDSDRAYWLIQYRVSGRRKEDIPTLYSSSENDQIKIISLLQNSGFDKSEILPGVLNYQKQEYLDENQKLVEEKHFLVVQMTAGIFAARLRLSIRYRQNCSRGLPWLSDTTGLFFYHNHIRK